MQLFRGLRAIPAWVRSWQPWTRGQSTDPSTSLPNPDPGIASLPNRDPNPSESGLLYLELSPSLQSLEWQELPRGGLCNWLGSSADHQNKALQDLVSRLNRPDRAGRCAIIDIPKQLNTRRWKLLSHSGVNWLVQPDSIYAALQSTLMLLSSRQFSLVAVTGLNISDLHPQDVRILRSAIPPQATLLFLHNVPWDHSGEPLPKPHCA